MPVYCKSTGLNLSWVENFKKPLNLVPGTTIVFQIY